MKSQTNATSPGRHFKPGHRAVSRMVTYALTWMAPPDFKALSAIIAVRLTAEERLFLAGAALEALTDREYWHLVQWIEDDGFPAEGRTAA